MKLPLNGRVMLPLLAALVFVGCIRWTETSKPEVTEFAPALKEETTDEPSAPTVGSFKVKFETSKGDVIVQVHPEWAPLGAAQFKKLVESGVYDEARFFRVIPGFMAQFGIAADPKLQAQFGEAIQDDPVKVSNKRGKVTFATSGPNSRTTQLFINYGDNGRLDSDGFSPFGEVILGMESVDAIESKHGETPDQGMIEAKGNEYLKAKFPELDYIKKATIFVDEPAEIPAEPAPAAEMKPESTPTPEATPAADAKPTEEMPAEKKPADPAPAEATPPAELVPAVTADPAMKKEPEPTSRPEETKPAPTGDTPASVKPAEIPTTPVEP